jgi:hypothetical protein
MECVQNKNLREDEEDEDVVVTVVEASGSRPLLSSRRTRVVAILDPLKLQGG